MKTDIVSFKSITSSAAIHRLDAPVHMTDGVLTRKLISKSPYPLLTIKEVSQRVWHAGRWRRVYVTSPEHGITLLGSSAILKADLSREKLISRKYTQEQEDKKLEKGWTLISCSGTIGNCAFANAQHAEKLASQDVIRLKPNNILRGGLVYAYLASKYGYAMLTQGTFGSVIQHIEPQNVESIPIPSFPESFQQEVDDLVQEAARLREEAADILDNADKKLKEKANLRELQTGDYDYYGPRSSERKVFCFVRNSKDINTTTINAFNHSARIRQMKLLITCEKKPLKDILLNGDTFSTGSFPRVEVKEGNGVMLINQKDIFDTIVKGKWISKRKVKTDNLVEYGEVLIAGVGTLGESETFCRAIFANEDLVGQLVSGEFIRMKTTNEVPSGYLYAWLASDYGFRLIRNTQAGTKLCRPIPRLLLQIPVPIIEKADMEEIDRLVREAHTLRYKANENERNAIRMVEQEIEKWNKH